MLRAVPIQNLRALGTRNSACMQWGGKAIFAILDQVLFAGSNFLVNILVARWLWPEAYGIFTIAYSVLLLLGAFHAAVLTAPLLVFGAAHYAGQFRRYLGLLVLGHVAITAIMSLVLAVTSAILWRLGMASMASGMCGVAVAAPFILLLWLARPACYVCFQTQWAAASGVLYLGTFTAVTYGLHIAHRLSPLSTLIAMGAASLLAGSWLLALLRPQWGCSRSVRSELRETFSLLGWGRLLGPDDHIIRPEADPHPAAIREHSRFARWSLATAVMSWVGANLQYFVLTATTSLASVATMRILDTMLLPFYHAQVALSRLVTPALSARAKDHARLVPFVVRMLVLWSMLGIFAYALLRWLGASITAALYGPTYSQYGSLLAWYGAILIPEILWEASFALFKAVVRMDLIFMYQMLFSVGVLISFLWLGRQGLPGIISARIVISYVLWPFVMLSVRAVCLTRGGS